MILHNITIVELGKEAHTTIICLTKSHRPLTMNNEKLWNFFFSQQSGLSKIVQDGKMGR
jgi:hypothetical protein